MAQVIETTDAERADFIKAKRNRENSPAFKRLCWSSLAWQQKHGESKLKKEAA
jgi:hypothetical protein